MSHKNQRAHSSSSTSTPSTSTPSASTSPPKNFSEAFEDKIRIFESEVARSALVTAKFRKIDECRPEISPPFLIIYETLMQILTADWFEEQEERLKIRVRKVLKDTLGLQVATDWDGAEAAMHKYNLRPFLD
ncbi:uncharacterized protein EAE98_010709 [Botrytis deweyae]|uniref:Uncharacterized protein n=1 Tax=Botrytis deweyae TaxID=2478750 RepID=A0ABQ7I7Z1_9HELO|nr:uncharacterized protein EAE98_010709 [Botrytis deweyae]KAF7916409.1 hypothetical protein EAE98_010709 [Botrytis deweyae]